MEVFGEGAFKPRAKNQRLFPEVHALVMSWITNVWRAMSNKVDRDRAAMELLEAEIAEIVKRRLKFACSMIWFLTTCFEQDLRQLIGTLRPFGSICKNASASWLSTRYLERMKHMRKLKVIAWNWRKFATCCRWMRMARLPPKVLVRADCLFAAPN